MTLDLATPARSERSCAVISTTPSASSRINATTLSSLGCREFLTVLMRVVTVASSLPVQFTYGCSLGNAPAQGPGHGVDAHRHDDHHQEQHPHRRPLAILSVRGEHVADAADT